MKSTDLLFLVCSVFLCLVAASASAFESIPWLTSLEEAKALSQENGKPLAVLITSTGCGACKKLKANFVAGPALDQFVDIAAPFNLVHLSNVKNLDKKWSPDGGYIPRLVFADAKANPLLEHKSASKTHKYFPGNTVEKVTAHLQAAATKMNLD